MHNCNDHWTVAVFRIHSETKSIEDICNKINTQPTRYQLKGELYSKRNPKSKIREENLLIYKSPLSDQETIESHIKYFLSFLKDKVKCLEELQAECEFDIMCAYSSENGQGGFTLDKNILKELAVYPIDLSINLYPPGEMES